MEFYGYPRPDGLAGTRNLIGIISNGVCTSDAASRIAREVDGCVHLAIERTASSYRLTKKLFIARSSIWAKIPIWPGYR